MNTGELVKHIVGTYDLPPKLEDRLVRIATRRIGELSIGGFDSVYRYIAELVDKFQVPYGAKVLSLDGTVTFGSKTTFHDLIGVEDSNLNRLFEDKKIKSNKERVSIYEAMSILKEQIDELDWKILLQLVGNDEASQLKTTPEDLLMTKEELLTAVPQIQERLEFLAKKYERDGRIVIPRRPLLYIQFEPEFLVRFGNRQYNGNPLAFFRKHLDVYGNISRYELVKFDSGLYRTLLRANQLQDAIPESKNSPLSAEEKNQIIAYHTTYNGDCEEATNHLGRSLSTIRKVWKDAELETQGKKTQEKYQENINKIIIAYIISHGNFKAARASLGYSIPTILKYWEEVGLKGIKGTYFPSNPNHDYINKVLVKLLGEERFLQLVRQAYGPFELHRLNQTLSQDLRNGNDSSYVERNEKLTDAPKIGNKALLKPPNIQKPHITQKKDKLATSIGKLEKSLRELYRYSSFHSSYGRW